MRSRRVIGGLVSCCLLLASCGSTPSQEDLTDAILIAAAEADPVIELSEQEASCIAAQLLESDLSDTTLEGLAEDFESPTVLESELNDVGPLVTKAALNCASDN